MNPRIVFTGGGTAGHVTPNLSIMAALYAEGWQIDYIGSETGVEKNIIAETGLPYHGVSSGKLRRYFSWRNFIDPFKIILGIAQSYRLLKQMQTDVIFSKGGFVAFPVVVAGWLNRIPVIAHESDLSPGLANRLGFPFVNKICLTFGAARVHFKRQDKVEVTGTPIRRELFEGLKANAYDLTGFPGKKPCLLIIGGSQGSASLNRAVRQGIDYLTEQYEVIHLCGKGKIDTEFLNYPGYFQMEYASQELPDLYAAADIVVSRAGANSLYEILALQKPHVLVPLPAATSRGDQIQNARFFQEQGISQVVNDQELNADTLIEAIEIVNQNKEAISARIKALKIRSATSDIIAIIKEALDGRATH